MKREEAEKKDCWRSKKPLHKVLKTAEKRMGKFSEVKKFCWAFAFGLSSSSQVGQLQRKNMEAAVSAKGMKVIERENEKPGSLEN